MLRRFIPALSVISLSFTPALAVPVTFDLRERPDATAEIVSGVITRGGITAILTPLVQGDTGVLNQTSSGFGVNANGSGDATSQIDGDAGAESISLTFDTHVTFLSLGLSQFGTGDSAGLQIAGFPEINITTTGLSEFANNNLVLFGQTVLLRHVAGNGFSFDNFTVELTEIVPPSEEEPTRVPDGGSTAAMLALPVCVMFATRVRRPGC